MPRLPSWLVPHKTGFRQPDGPEIQEERLRAYVNAARRSSGRRLSDRIEAVFEEACLARDIETAEYLLAAIDCQYRVIDVPWHRNEMPLKKLKERFELQKAAVAKAGRPAISPG